MDPLGGAEQEDGVILRHHGLQQLVTVQDIVTLDEGDVVWELGSLAWRSGWSSRVWWVETAEAGGE